MWLISQLLMLWKRRLERLVADASTAQAIGGDWLWRMRQRILSFLVSRYSDPVAAAQEQSRLDIVPRDPVDTFCIVEAMDCPPRPKEDLAKTIQAISHENFEAKRRLRWRWF